jgi:hypothetical protein
LLKQGYYQEEAFGVNALRNPVFDIGFQCPKLVKDTMNGINVSGFVSGVIEWQALGGKLVKSVW